MNSTACQNVFSSSVHGGVATEMLQYIKARETEIDWKDRNVESGKLCAHPLSTRPGESNNWSRDTKVKTVTHILKDMTSRTLTT